MRQTTVVRYYSAAFMAVMAYCSYHSFTEPIPSERPPVQESLYSQVPTAKPGPPPTASPAENGEALLYMRIPRFGEDWLWTALEGVDMDTLAKGPGHFPTSALPGEMGNAAFAAHRAGHGDPFIDFEELVPGDEITLLQNGAEWTYEVLRSPERIQPDEDERVLRPLNKTNLHRLTLVTCWPKYGASERIFIRAKLVRESKTNS